MAVQRRVVLRAAISLTLVGLLLWTVDWQGSLARLGDMATPWAYLAVVLVAATIVTSAWRWQLLVRAQGLSLGLATATRLYWIGVFFNNLLPSNVGGDVVRLAFARQIGGAARIAASILVERATGFLVLVALALAALLLGPAPDGAGAAAGLAAAALALGAAGLAALRHGGRAVALVAASRLGRGRTVGRLLRKLEALAAAIRDYGRDRRALAVTCAISVLFYATVVLAHFATIRAVHGEVALLQVALVTPLILAVSAVPVSLNGLGIAEVASVVLYAQVGLPPEVALAAAILRRLVVILNALVGAAFWLAGRDPGRPHPPAVGPVEASVPTPALP